MADDYSRFKNLDFKGFQRLAADPSLTPYEKIGFPDAYREGKEEAIFADIRRKLPNLESPGRVVLDIGPGCSDVPRMLIDLCERQQNTLLLVDSPEMLALLPDSPTCVKTAGRFPQECGALLELYHRRVDVVLTYSVLHYVMAEGNLFDFVDRGMMLLAEGGEMLIGDIPNISKRKRFFSSRAGIRFHRQFTGASEVPAVEFNRPEPGDIDDSVVLSLIMRARAAGFDAYILPQNSELPMANRREDILIRRS